MTQTIRKGNEFEIVTRVVIQNKNKVLLCNIKGEKFYFFPGGHIELSEFAKESLAREIKEEIGASIKNINFIGLMENIFGNRHEMNIVFSANINKTKIEALEEHMEFQWLDIKLLQKANILPHALKKAIIKWFKDKKNFWVSERK